MEKREKIGQVILDYRFYSGQDLYSDGHIEDELLNIVETYEEDEFGRVIKEKNTWPILYHLSQVRQNIVSWFPFQKGHKVLEIGSGCGAITGAIAERANRVDCVELSRRRSLINANRNKKHNNITIKVGNFEEIEPFLDHDYDVITLIGVWEYSALYLQAEDPFRKFLQLLKKHMKPEGKVIIAIENKFGLKYWAGCREDHTGRFFEGIEGYTKTDSAITFGKNELEKIFAETGYSFQFYYPYPDYKLPLKIYSDDFLPKEGSLKMNGSNLDTDRLELFDEQKVFDEITKENMFPFFSNSFLIVLGNKDVVLEDEKIVYAEYFNERIEKFRINKIIKKNRQRQITEIHALHQNAMKHIEDMSALTLSNQDIENQKIGFQPWKKKDRFLISPIVLQKTSGEKIKKLCTSGKIEEAKEKILQIIHMVEKLAQYSFVETKDFVQIFGSYSWKNEAAIEGKYFNLDIDKLINENGHWNIVESEWNFTFLLPVRYVIYRFLQKALFKDWEIDTLYLFTEQEKERFVQMDKKFEQYICGDCVPISKSALIKPKYKLDDDCLKKNFVKVYYDFGSGLTEENTDRYFYTTSEEIIVDIRVYQGARAMRIDPMENSGVVILKEILAVTAEERKVPIVETNGREIEPSYYLFDTNDPWFYLPVLKGEIESIHMVLEIEEISKKILDVCSRQRKNIEGVKRSKWKKLKDKML